MWKCKECGGEIKDVSIVRKHGDLDKNKEVIDYNEVDTEDYWYECGSCGNDTNRDDLELEDIAEWVD